MLMSLFEGPIVPALSRLSTNRARPTVQMIKLLAMIDAQKGTPSLHGLVIDEDGPWECWARDYWDVLLLRAMWK